MAYDPRRQERRKYCWSCGSPWPKSAISCEKCGSNDSEDGAARPTKPIQGDEKRFHGPWRLLPWPPQGVVAEFGGPGSGKSSLACMIDPVIWMSKEQEPRPMADLWRRIRPDTPMPEIVMVSDAADVRHALTKIQRGPIVLDSATSLGLKDGLEACYALAEWAKTWGDRVLIIAQVNSQGDIAGYNEIPHLVDAVINIAPDPWGVRSFRIEKSRWSALDQIYWSFGEKGEIITPDFVASYTVEGTPGAYHLHPYPLSGAKWHGISAALAGVGALEPGTASCGIVAPYMPAGFVEPMDANERRRFAEQNGLKWITALAAKALVDEHADTKGDSE